MATYSLAITGAPAEQLYQAKTLTLPDTSATAGGQANATQNGTQVLCKGQDGSFAWYTLDAQRSTPAIPVLLRVS